MQTTRRNVLGLGTGAVVASTLPALVNAQTEGAPFSHQTVIDISQKLAGEPFTPPVETPGPLTEITYDTYRQIRYRKNEAIWGVSPTKFSIELFAPGFLYRDLIDIAIVENGRARPLTINDDSFDLPDPALAPLLSRAGKFAGFRLHYPLNRSDYRDEFLVFQGASYFRAVSKEQTYGLSARGLAINVAEPKGEEFPLFRSFWIERPAADADAIVVHALLDSVSVTGAYRFGIYPGGATTMDISVTLFPRRPMEHVGLAPLTSMYLHGPADPSSVPDYRPAVHDSEILAMTTGAGETLARPLVNPRTLQPSAFVDRNPKGFGLIQRARSFTHFEDLEAGYGTRPSAWVAPKGEWGAGYVQLFEIPTDSEVHDNIVAYWRPSVALQPGIPFEYGYRLTWPKQVPGPKLQAHVVRSARSRRLTDRLPQMAIDYATEIPASNLTLAVTVNPGELAEALLQDNPHTGGVRAFITFDPGEAQLIEMRAELRRDGQPIGETWLYRWLSQ